MRESIQFYQSRKADTGITWILFLFLGWSYGSLGSMVKQIFYYLTAGGLGIWALYVLFTLNSKIKKHNLQIAKECGCTNREIEKLGLLT